MPNTIPQLHIPESLIVPKLEDIDFLISFLDKISEDIDLSDYDISDIEALIKEKNIETGEEINVFEICDSILRQWKKVEQVPENIELVGEIFSLYIDIFFGENYDVTSISDSMKDSSGLQDLGELVRAKNIFLGLGIEFSNVSDEIAKTVIEDIEMVEEWLIKLKTIKEGLQIVEEEKPPSTREIITNMLKKVMEIFSKK